MTDYSNGNNILLKRPEPGRPIHPVQTIQIKEKPADVKVDTNAIADAVIKAISGKISGGVVIKNAPEILKDDFDNSESLRKLADAMTNREEKEAKLEGLGKIKETKRDKKETDQTIDILSKLGD